MSSDWINALGEAWYNDAQIVDPLSKAKFSAKISYGLINEKEPQCVLHIFEGSIVSASLYQGEAVDWDLRAEAQHWEKWISQGFGLTKLGPAVATKTLQFFQGDYRQMIRNPLLSRPFLRHFVLMGQINTKF